MSLTELTYGDGPGQKNEGWLNPIAMSQLQEAVKAEKDVVYLNGVGYNITYGHSFTWPVSKETVPLIHLARKDGDFSPRGYVSVKRILAFRFES